MHGSSATYSPTVRAPARTSAPSRASPTSPRAPTPTAESSRRRDGRARARPSRGRRTGPAAPASAARAAAIPNAGRNERVTASVTLSISSSRARAMALSPSAPRSSNSAARSGTCPRGASSIAVRNAQVTGSLSPSDSSVSIIVRVAAERRPLDAGLQARRQHRGDDDEPEDEPGVAGADRHRARLHRRAVGGDGRRVEDLVDEVEPGAAQGEGEGRHRRLLAGQQGQPDQPDGQEQGAADGHPGRRGRLHQPPDGHAERQRRDEHGALHRAVPPHLDRQEHAEEQRPDEGGEHEGEPDVGHDHVAPPCAGAPVHVALPAQRPCRRVRRHDQGGGDDRRLDEEDRPPVEQLGEHAAEGRADRRSDGAGHRPPPPGPVAGDGTEDGERPGEQQRGADALGAAGDEQHGEASRRTRRPATPRRTRRRRPRRAPAAGPGGAAGRRGRR